MNAQSTSTTRGARPPHDHHHKPVAVRRSLAEQLVTALPGAFRKLDPRELLGSPVMLVVEIGAAATTVMALARPQLFA